MTPLSACVRNLTDSPSLSSQGAPILNSNHSVPFTNHYYSLPTHYIEIRTDHIFVAIGWTASKRLSYMESNWPYFVGFGLPIAVLTSLPPSFIIRSV